MTIRVQIKGLREGLLVTPAEGEWREVRAALLEHLQAQAEFLRGGRLILDLGNQALHAADLGQLRDAISGLGLSLGTVLSHSPVTEQNAKNLGLAIRLVQPHPERPEPAADTSLSGERAILVHRTLRSGFNIQHHGHVTIIGDVNPGAEIVAGGDVVVWGRLRGVVHAGAEGEENAIVCALDLSPTQLRIAGQIAISPKRRGKPQPETARLFEKQVVTEVWHVERKG